jgi:H2-forming N5,N10-methylenetetrahydromethanopterin dehydrogenase-like enzyme
VRDKEIAIEELLNRRYKAMQLENDDERLASTKGTTNFS